MSVINFNVQTDVQRTQGRYKTWTYHNNRNGNSRLGDTFEVDTQRDRTRGVVFNHVFYPNEYIKMGIVDGYKVLLIYGDPE